MEKQIIKVDYHKCIQRNTDTNHYELKLPRNTAYKTHVLDIPRQYVTEDLSRLKGCDMTYSFPCVNRSGDIILSIDLMYDTKTDLWGLLGIYKEHKDDNKVYTLNDIFKSDTEQNEQLTLEFEF